MEVRKAKVNGYTGFFLDADKNLYDSDGNKLHSYKYGKNDEAIPGAKQGDPFYLFPHRSRIHALVLTDEFMEDYLDEDGQIPESNTTGTGARTKPFVAFKEDGEYVGRFEKQMEFVRAVPELDMPNSLPPVLKGRVRMTKGYILFYEDDQPSGKGYTTWLEEDASRNRGDFPNELHEAQGWSLGSTRSIDNQKTEEEEVLEELMED